MQSALIAYVATAIVFFGLDFVWLGQMQAALYRPRIGALLLDKPDLAVAAAFYLIYVVGVVAFAVLPAVDQGSWLRALGAGALLGLVAYGTYDMTNLATLAGWSMVVSLADMAWGVALTGVSATAGYFVVRALA